MRSILSSCQIKSQGVHYCCEDMPAVEEVRTPTAP